MRRTLALLPGLLVGLALWSLPATSRAADELTWRTDLHEARLEAHRTNRPLFVVFRCEP